MGVGVRVVVALRDAQVVKLDEGVDLVVDAVTVRMSLVSPRCQVHRRQR